MDRENEEHDKKQAAVAKVSPEKQVKNGTSSDEKKANNEKEENNNKKSNDNGGAEDIIATCLDGGKEQGKTPTRTNEEKRVVGTDQTSAEDDSSGDPDTAVVTNDDENMDEETTEKKKTKSNKSTRSTEDDSVDRKNIGDGDSSFGNGYSEDKEESTSSSSSKDEEDPSSSRKKRAAADNNGRRRLEVYVGMKFQKEFDDGEYYTGTIVSGPELVMDERTREEKLEWHAQYEDGDEEDLSIGELETSCVIMDEEPRNKLPKRATPPSAKKVTSSYDRAKEALCALPSMTEDEVVAALEKVGPPYGLQAVMDAVHRARDSKDFANPNSGLFKPEVGLRIRKMFAGKNWYGTVTKDAETVEEPPRFEGEKPKQVLMWQVTYDDGDVDDMTWQELFQHRADRPIRSNPCRGRALQSLELFGGCGIVTQEFALRKWAVCSIDNSSWSNATIKKDLLQVEPKDLEFVPDFIWASPPCHTYSPLAGGKHRVGSEGLYEKTAEARHHNYLFTHMAKIMEWAKKLHPHLIVVIENPVGQMAKMPLLKEVQRSLGLYLTHVHYCALGRDDKKPTCLWTNDFGLHCRFSDFKCSERRCPYFKSGTHPMGCRSHGSRFNAAAIPNALAEEVAQYVDSKFYMDRVPYTKAAPPPSWEESGQTKSWRDAGLLDRLAATEESTAVEDDAAANNEADPPVEEEEEADGPNEEMETKTAAGHSC